MTILCSLVFPECRFASCDEKVGKWAMLVDQLFSIRDVAPDGFQPAYLITEVLFLVMLQVRIFVSFVVEGLQHPCTLQHSTEHPHDVSTSCVPS